MPDSYSIRELADEFDVTTRTLRFYEEKGLLSPVRINQTRRYSGADRTRLRLIRRGKRLGLTLDESSAIILLYDPAAQNTEQLQTLIEKIQEKKKALEEQQRDLQQTLQDLTAAEQRCVSALGDMTTDKKRKTAS